MKVIVAGDLVPNERCADFLYLKQFDKILGGITPCTKGTDCNIVNLEAPIVSKSRIISGGGNCLKINKLGSYFFCDENILELLEYCGFDTVTLANNHFRDYGTIGVENTIELLERKGINHVGGGTLQEASKTLYVKTQNGETLAIINCCEHEFSIATSDAPGANPLNPIKQYYAIIEAKTQADYIVVITHGGHEHYQLPSPRMQETYRFFIECGADAVINHHQHCYSGYEVYHGNPIFYGLGNLSFDSIMDNKYRASTWNYGYLVELTLSDSSPKFKLIPYKQNTESNVGTHLLNESEKSSFYNEIEMLNKHIANSKLLHTEFNKRLETFSHDMEILFSPYRDKYLRYACYKGWIPTFMTKKYKTELLNRLECESHYEKVIYMLKKQT